MASFDGGVCVLQEVQALTGALQTQRRETQRVQAELTALQDRYSVAAKRDVPGSSTLSSTEASGAEMQVCCGTECLGRTKVGSANRRFVLAGLSRLDRALRRNRETVDRAIELRGRARPVSTGR